MRRAVLWAHTLLLSSQALQTPLSDDLSQSLLPHLNDASVDLTDANFIFNGLAGLLQQLPNSAHPNGHIVVPAVISAHTLLYHARMDTQEPPSPEWLAFEPEMSYAIMVNRPRSTFLCTYAARRDLRVLYFDGLSAAISGTGWLDVQEVLIHGRGAPVLSRGGWWDDPGRIVDLCAWGRPLGLDGFIRMNTGFEIMWCDFEDGLDLVSHINISAPDMPRPWEDLLEPLATGVRGESMPSAHQGGPGARFPIELTDPRPHGFVPIHPPDTFPRSPFTVSAGYEWLRTATHRYFTPPPGVRPIPSGLLSFYDAASFPSLAAARARRNQTTMSATRVWADISDTDAAHARSRVEAALRRPDLWTRGGFDWFTTARQVTETWGARLAQMNATLAVRTDPTSDPDAPLAFNATRAVGAMRLVAYTLLNPYLDTAALPRSDTSVPARWLPQTLARCARVPRPAALTREERVLRASVETALTRLCAFAGGVLAHSIGAGKAPDADLAVRWRAELAALMRWLDWPMWIRCAEDCGWERLCLIPMWPVYGSIALPGGPGVPEKYPSSEEPRATCVPFAEWQPGVGRRF